MPEYLFCQFRENEFEALHRGLSQVFNISQKQLKELYGVMQQEFEVEGYPEHTLPRNIFHSFNENFQKRYEEALVIGVDIPTILEKNDNVLPKKTVVIVGQDPLRKSNHRFEEIRLATPYALHLRDCREKKSNTRVYFEWIKVLLDEGYRVYLTDVFKIWVSQAGSDGGITLSKQDEKRFIQVLRTELEIFAPIAVITWGNKARIGIEELNLDINHFNITHPSGAANGAWSQRTGEPATRENRLNDWRQQVIDYLSGL